MSRSQRKIKNLWINPQYQAKYIFWITLTGLLLVLINSSIFYAFTRENYALLVDLSPMTDEAKTMLYKELRQILILLVSGSSIFLAIVAIVGLVFSHRAAGPLYNFKRTFSLIRAGDRNARVRLRPTDEFQDVAQSFNEMMDALVGKEGSNK